MTGHDPDASAGMFGIGEGVRYGLPAPPRWMGSNAPMDMGRVMAVLDSREVVYGRLEALDWEGGNLVFVDRQEERISVQMTDVRGLLLSERSERQQVYATEPTLRVDLRYRDGSQWPASAQAASADLFGLGLFSLVDRHIRLLFVPWRVLDSSQATLGSALPDGRRLRMQREVAFLEGGYLDRLSEVRLAGDDSGIQREAQVLGSSFAKAFCKAFGG